MAASTSEVARALAGCNFPMRKQQLLHCAQEHHANEKVIDSLKKLPDRTYNSMAGIFKAVGEKRKSQA